MTLTFLCFALLITAIAGSIVGFGRNSLLRWAIAVVPFAIFLVGYAWHLAVLARHQPGAFLQYGWFDTAAGKAARASIIHVPYFTACGAALLFLIVATATMRDRKVQLAALWLWAIALFVVFSFYFLVQLIQGDAAIFI